MGKKLWLTYAWINNEEEDVDYVVTKLNSLGIEVRLDRTRIIAGQRLWEQIDQNILAEDLDGFAIYATKESLSSNACQEELAIALDRVLRSKGAKFPLIGIFPTPIDRELIPSSIATRLFVSLKDEGWSSAVASSLSQENHRAISEVSPYFLKEHIVGDRYVYEMRPRDGYWHPAAVSVLTHQRDKCLFPFVGARNRPEFSPAMFQFDETLESIGADGSRWLGFILVDQVDNTKSLYLPTKEKLKRLAFGNSSKMFVIDFC